MRDVSFKLITAVVKAWEDAKSGVPGRNTWVTAREGKVYTRWFEPFQRIDIASVDIKERHRGKGILKALLAAARKTTARCVRLECIMDRRLAASAVTWNFPGWRRTHDGEHTAVFCSVTVEWHRENV